MSLRKEYFTQEETEAKNYVCNLCQKTFVAPATGRRPTCGLTCIANTVKHTIDWNRKTRTKKQEGKTSQGYLFWSWWYIGPHGTPARCTLQFVRRCYGLRGIYGRFDSTFDSNAKNTQASIGLRGHNCPYNSQSEWMGTETNEWMKMRGF